MKLSRILIILFLVVAVFLVWRLFTGYTSSEQQLPPLHTEKADRGEVSRRVIAFGSLQPVQKVTVGSQVSGIIEDIFADFNSEVRKDERSEEHTSELQSRGHLVCRLLLEKKKN